MRQLKYALMLLVVLAMVAAACSSDDSETTTTAAAGGGEATETTTAAAVEGTDMTGAEFTLFGAPQAAELDAATGFVNVYNSEKGSSITVEGSDSYETQIRIRVEGGNAPVVSFTPQPAMVCEFADMGELISLEDMGFDIAELEATRGKFMMDLGLCDDGKHYGMPWYPNFKSIVFYQKDVFAEKGYEIPATYADMVSLSETMVADGFAPWCFGYESDAATGWAGTDWIEDIAIRMIGADKYLQWTKGELRFDTPEIKAVFEKFNEILFGEGFVLGGAENIAATNFRDSPLPMFNDPPSCLMLKQGSFIASYFPEGQADAVGSFAFPSIDGVGGALGGGDTLMVFENDPQAIQFVKDVITPDWMCTHASATGGGQSPYGGHGVEGVEFLPGSSEVNPLCNTTEANIVYAEAITAALAANTFVFDGGDMMPAEVGSGTFWTGMVDHSRGTDLDTVLADIDKGWPEG